MPAIGTILRILLQVLAGVGAAELADKFLPDKVPGYEPVSPGLRLGKKLLIFLGVMGAGGLAWNFINRKFHVLTPRHARHTRKKSRKR